MCIHVVRMFTVPSIRMRIIGVLQCCSMVIVRIVNTTTSAHISSRQLMYIIRRVTTLIIGMNMMMVRPNIMYMDMVNSVRTM